MSRQPGAYPRSYGTVSGAAPLQPYSQTRINISSAAAPRQRSESCFFNLISQIDFFFPDTNQFLTYIRRKFRISYRPLSQRDKQRCQGMTASQVQCTVKARSFRSSADQFVKQPEGVGPHQIFLCEILPVLFYIAHTLPHKCRSVPHHVVFRQRP